MRFPSRSQLTGAAPRVARAVTSVARQAPHLASYAVQLSTEAAGGVRDRALQRLGRERPRPQAPSEAAVAAGAPGAARPVVERVAAEEQPPETPQPDQLPISDWDHASMPSLRARIARLSLDELLQLRAYETEHAGRLAVLTMLDNRIAKVDRTPVGAKEVGETDVSETGAGETGAGETGAGETDVSETGADETGVDATDVDATDVDETNP